MRKVNAPMLMQVVRSGALPLGKATAPETEARRPSGAPHAEYVLMVRAKRSWGRALAQLPWARFSTSTACSEVRG